MAKAQIPNTYDTREAWLRAATDKLRPYFEECGHPLPDKIRYAIAFTSGGKRGRIAGECWPPSASADGNYELIIRCDFAEPIEVLGILVHELIHAVLPEDAKHGKLYKAAALKIGLTGKMMHALPGPLLTDRLNALAADLGPLPHAKLDFASRAADKPKKQGTRMLKAECGEAGCGFLVRLAMKQVKQVGVPHCPKHGPMLVDIPEDEEAETETETMPKAETVKTLSTPALAENFDIRSAHVGASGGDI